MGKTKFGRKEKRRSQYPRFLIVLEGAVTELQYFETIRRSLRAPGAQISCLPPGATSPIEIVRRAISERNRSNKTDPYDHVWCVFDTETKLTQNARDGLAESLNIASHNKVSIALSNPCFELWLLLHEEDRQAWIDSHALQSRCSSLQIVEAKHLCNPALLVERYTTARERALALEAKHDRDGTNQDAQRNPSSRVFKLVDIILASFPSR
jgi:hypothetical protein